MEDRACCEEEVARKTSAEANQAARAPRIKLETSVHTGFMTPETLICSIWERINNADCRWSGGKIHDVRLAKDSHRIWPPRLDNVFSLLVSAC